MKSNDNIPEDEMMLAEALAAARELDLEWCDEYLFKDEDGLALDASETIPYGTRKCCAYGALLIAGTVPFRWDDRPKNLAALGDGNDHEGSWLNDASDEGESLGWAFRCAMTQDEP